MGAAAARPPPVAVWVPYAEIPFRDQRGCRKTSAMSTPTTMTISDELLAAPAEPDGLELHLPALAMPDRSRIMFPERFPVAARSALARLGRSGVSTALGPDPIPMGPIREP